MIRILIVEDEKPIADLLEMSLTAAGYTCDCRMSGTEAADAVGYKESLSCHTLRKTFAYWLYMDTGGDIVMVQEILGHADPSITRRYIGIDQQKKEKAINSLKF